MPTTLTLKNIPDGVYARLSLPGQFMAGVVAPFALDPRLFTMEKQILRAFPDQAVGLPTA